jgi:hypothetical protein
LLRKLLRKYFQFPPAARHSPFCYPGFARVQPCQPVWFIRILVIFMLVSKSNFPLAEFNFTVSQSDAPVSNAFKIFQSDVLLLDWCIDSSWDCLCLFSDSLKEGMVSISEEPKMTAESAVWYWFFTSVIKLLPWNNLRHCKPQHNHLFLKHEMFLFW